MGVVLMYNTADRRKNPMSRTKKISYSGDKRKARKARKAHEARKAG